MTLFLAAHRTTARAHAKTVDACSRCRTTDFSTGEDAFTIATEACTRGAAVDSLTGIHFASVGCADFTLFAARVLAVILDAITFKADLTRIADDARTRFGAA